MSNIKERLYGAILAMDEEKAERAWSLIERMLGYGFEEVEPTPDEIAVLDAYERGEEDYQPIYSIKEVEQMLFEDC